jgi:beta-glucanase (GH16 family)
MLTVVGSVSAAAGTVNPSATASWVVWSEGFAGAKGSGVNQQIWKYDTGKGIFGTGEIEAMTNSPSNVALDGAGNLDITAVNNGGSWTSGRIQSIKTYAAPAGGELTITAAIEQPGPANGLGYWPAFWLLGPGSWPADGEIDVMEDVNALSLHSGTLHCGNLTQENPDGTTGPCHEYTGLTSGNLKCSQCQTGFHNYSVVIDRRVSGNEQIRWYEDNAQFYAVSENQVGTAVWTQAVDHGFSIIFDLAIGGSYPDGVCKCTAPSSQTTSGGAMSVKSITVSETL